MSDVDVSPDDASEHRVTALELYFDLVFVFDHAGHQLAHVAPARDDFSGSARSKSRKEGRPWPG